jgi:ATP synthase protein I
MVRIASTTGAVGLEVALSIAAGYLGGQWLDRKLGTGPWLGYLGLVAGIGAAIKALIRVTRAYQKSLKDDDASNDPKP